jgi:hypothetical protein
LDGSCVVLNGLAGSHGISGDVFFGAVDSKASGWSALFYVLQQFIAWSNNLKKDRIFVILEQNSKLDDNDDEKLLKIADPVSKFPMT